jgi:hypothetical protein
MKNSSDERSKRYAHVRGLSTKIDYHRPRPSTVAPVGLEPRGGPRCDSQDASGPCLRNNEAHENCIPTARNDSLYSHMLSKHCHLAGSKQQLEKQRRNELSNNSETAKHSRRINERLLPTKKSQAGGNDVETPTLSFAGWNRMTDNLYIYATAPPPP